MAEFEIEIPKYIDNLQLPSPEMLTYYRNAEDRTFWIDYDIDTSLLEISKSILLINKLDKDIKVDDRKSIKIFIFSYGGTLDSCYNFLDICAISKTPIITINAGVAMSAGLLMLLAGHKRYSLSRSQAMIHSGSGGMQGTFEQMEESQKSYKKTIDEMRKYILERTNIDLKTFNKNKTKDWYLTSEEQLETGIINYIVTDIDEIL